MENIHFSTNGVIGINLSGEEQPNGDLRLLRVTQSATAPRAPEMFTVRAEERHGLMEYLNRKFGGKGVKDETQAEGASADRSPHAAM